MKKILLLLPVFGAGLFLSLQGQYGTYSKYHADGLEGVLNAAGPPAAKTGAPGEGNCTDCHTGTALSASGVVTYTFSGSNNEYLPNTSYDITLSVASGPKNGFQMTILDANDDAAGTFTAGTNTATFPSGGRQYIQQSSASGITSFSFIWNAPSSDMGDLTVYYAFNKTNNSSSSSGDEIYLGQQTINVSASAAVTKYESLKKEFNAFYISNDHEVQFNFATFEQSRVFVKFQDMAGRMICEKDLGILDKGQYNERVSLGDFDYSGIVIASVFVDNYVLSKKIVLQ